MNICYQSDLAIHSGEYLEEILKEMNIDMVELSSKIKVPKREIDAIIGGQIGINSKIALKLKDALGIPAHIWTGLESEYKSVLASKYISDR